MTTPAQELLGKELNNGWRIIEQVVRGDDVTGGHFSEAYIVGDAQGRRAFLKALDYSAALQSTDPARALQALTAAYNFERDILARCRSRRLDRIVLALDDGSISVDPGSPIGVVQYIIFELADGDVRKHLKLAEHFDIAWALRSLHQVAVGLSQLHANDIAHQDVKPSNVMVFERVTSKIGDFGRAALKGVPAPYDDAPVAGDLSYAPPEQLYGATTTDWGRRRLACDVYLLGSMAVFLFTAVSMTSLWLGRIHASQHWTVWRGSFEDVLPFVRDAFAQALAEFGAALPPDLRPELVESVGQLCDPDPNLRGHPRNRVGHADPYSLARYVSAFDRLARRAEAGIVGKMK